MEKKKDPAFLFYPESFLVGVMDMTDEEVGQYIRMLCRQHQKGHIPAKVMERQEEAVQEKFSIDGQGKYYNKRLEYEMEQRRAFAERQEHRAKVNSENGKKGGRPRKEDTIGNIEEWAREIFPEELQDVFIEFAELRASMDSPITSKKSVARWYEKLQGMSRRVEKQKAIIEQSVDGHWKNFYPLSPDVKVQYKETPTREYTEKEYVPMPGNIEKELAESLGWRGEK